MYIYMYDSGVPIKALLSLVCYNFSDGEGGGGCRGWGVVDMQHVLTQLTAPVVKDKVIHQLTLRVHGLRTDTGRAPCVCVRVCMCVCVCECVCVCVGTLHTKISSQQNSCVGHKTGQLFLLTYILSEFEPWRPSSSPQAIP